MANQFEQPALLNAGEAAAAREFFEKQLEEGDTIFVPISGTDDAWTLRVGDKPATLKADYDHGIYELDANTGIVLKEATAAGAFEYANSCRSFRYKAGEYQAIDKSGAPSWEAGSTVHLVFCLLIGSEGSWFDLKDALHAARHYNDESLEGLAEVVDGKSSVPDAIEGSNHDGLSRLRALLSS